MKNKLKFSIIIPAYNIEKYIDKCINSIIEQTYKNYEIIIINDGSTDNTKNIIDKYKTKKKVTIINQNNKGLSESRNIGVKKATGNYILFVDGDDYIDKKLLETLNNIIEDEDIIRFQLRTVDEKYNIIKEYSEKEFKYLSGIDAFNEIIKYKYIELACCYAYKREFLIKNNFKFKKGTYHEDFGLIPLIIIKANKISSINYIGYNYVQRNNSIMNNNDYNKELKKAYDVLEHYDYLKKNNDKYSMLFNSYIANSVILKLVKLKGNDYTKYKHEINKRNMYSDLLNDTIARKIKRIIIKISPKIYYKLFGGKK